MATFGARGWWIIQSSIVLSQIGFACAYLIFIRENIHSLFAHISTNSALASCLFLLVFLANVRDLSGLGIFSLFADFANLLAYSVVFWFDASTVEEDGMKGNALSFDGIPFALGVAIYCYEGAGMIISLEAAVPPDKRHDFPRIFKTALSLITLLYVLPTKCGLSFFVLDSRRVLVGTPGTKRAGIRYSKTHLKSRCCVILKKGCDAIVCDLLAQGTATEVTGLTHADTC